MCSSPAAIFQLATGLANVTTWYPWSFSFRPTHFALAWVAIGALVVHIAVKLPVIREALAGPADEEEPPGDGLSRRGLVRTAGRGVGGRRAPHGRRHGAVAAQGVGVRHP